MIGQKNFPLNPDFQIKSKEGTRKIHVEDLLVGNIHLQCTEKDLMASPQRLPCFTRSIWMSPAMLYETNMDEATRLPIFYKDILNETANGL